MYLNKGDIIGWRWHGDWTEGIIVEDGKKQDAQGHYFYRVEDQDGQVRGVYEEEIDEVLLYDFKESPPNYIINRLRKELK